MGRARKAHTETGPLGGGAFMSLRASPQRAKSRSAAASMSSALLTKTSHPTRLQASRTLATSASQSGPSANFDDRISGHSYPQPAAATVLMVQLVDGPISSAVPLMRVMVNGLTVCCAAFLHSQQNRKSTLLV